MSKTDDDEKHEQYLLMILRRELRLQLRRAEKWLGPSLCGRFTNSRLI